MAPKPKSSLISAPLSGAIKGTVEIPKSTAKVGDANIPPTTTAAEDQIKIGQRKINLLWEWTQASLAIIVTVSTLIVAGRLAWRERGDQAAFLLLSNAFFAVISVYLTRTNHTKTGGVKEDDEGR